ncbi:MAG TPA: ABC transporter substrate-binding protein [Acetobacteraceae bacterium]|nr:ABC transporter substrate-binding protein [Acetobacteraceae bacterium]
MTGDLTRRNLAFATALMALAPNLARAAAPVRVACKPDTEGRLLGDMIIAMLNANGIATVNRLGLGGTKIIRPAILSVESDMYPEYTGNGAFFFHLESDPIWKNAQQGYQKVKALDAEKNQIIWLQPAAADNTWAIAVRKDVADQHHLKTLEDFAGWVNGGGGTKIAASAEFVESPAALPAFEKAYGFKLKGSQILTLAGGNTAATIRAAAEGTSGVNTAMAYGTDGALALLGMVVLQDDKHVQMVYAPAPVIREAVLQANPRIKDLLAPVFASLDTMTLRRLNADIAVKGEDSKQVAETYLKQKGFLK